MGKVDHVLACALLHFLVVQVYVLVVLARRGEVDGPMYVVVFPRHGTGLHVADGFLLLGIALAYTTECVLS